MELQRSPPCAAPVQIVVQRATDVKPTTGKGSPTAARETEEVMCFLELQGLHKAMVSPVAAQGSAPEFDWAFYVPLDTAPTTEGAVSVRFIARNFLAKKQTQVRPRTITSALGRAVLYSLTSRPWGIKRVPGSCRGLMSSLMPSVRHLRAARALWQEVRPVPCVACVPCSALLDHRHSSCCMCRCSVRGCYGSTPSQPIS